MKTTRQLHDYALASAVLALCALLLPTTASAKSKTPFTTKEIAHVVNPGAWITDGTSMFITGMQFEGTEVASDPRLSGTEAFVADGIMDLATGARMLWGPYHLENEDGAWDGYWYSDSSTATGLATMSGSGKYEGLVARWTWDETQWAGYIVENGPGEVPMRVRGWRVEQIQWIGGVVVNPATMLPTDETAVIGKVTLVEGGGLASHAGKVTDQTEVAVLSFLSPTKISFSSFGSEESANGDLLNWIGKGTTDLQTGVADIEAHWLGGTGRFEAAVGSFEGQVTEEIDPATGEGSYGYDFTGSIRY